MGFKEFTKDSLTRQDENRILAQLEKSHVEARSNQREARRKWAKLEHYLAGRQYWVAGGPGKLGRPVGHEVASAASATGNVDDEYVIFNEIRRIFMSNMQRLTSYFFDPQIIPDTTQTKDKQAARIGRIYLADLIRRYPSERLKAAIARLTILYNKAFIKVHWDPTQGRLIRKPTKGLKGFFLGRDLMREGDVVWDVVNPRNVLLPKFTTSLKHADWLEEVHTETVDYVYRRFDKVVEEEQVRADDLGIQGAGAGWVDDPESEGRLTGATEEQFKGVLLKERYIMPCPQYQKGAIFTWTSKQLLRASDLLSYYPGLPYFECGITYNDKDIYDNSILWDLIPIQDLINEDLAAGRRWMRMISLLRRWVPTASNVDLKDLNNATSVNLKYDGETPPAYEEVGEFPPALMELLNVFRDFSQSHGFSNELAKTRRALSGNALGILQEMDDTIFRPALESYQAAYSAACNFSLQLAAKYIDNPRLIKMSSMQGWQIIEGFKGEMLSGNFHAEVNLMSGLPSNKVMRLEYLKSLYKDGLLDKDTVTAYLEFPNDGSALEEIQKQHEIADSIVKSLQDEKNYVPQETEHGTVYLCKVMYHKFDNHALIAAKLQTAMQEGFDHWNQWVQMACLEHWQYHMNFLKPPVPLAGPLSPPAPMPPMTPPTPGVFPGPPEMPGEGLNGILADSFQNSAQQPPREQIPQPMNSGFTS